MSAAKGTVIRWALKDEAPAAVYRFTDADGSPMCFDAVAASPDGGVLLATGSNGAVAFRAADGAELWRQTSLKRSEVALGIDGAFAVGSGASLVWLDARNGDVLHAEAVEGDWTEHLLPLPGGRAIVAPYRKPQLHLYDLAERGRLASVDLPMRPEKQETCRLAVGGGKLAISRWDYSFDVLSAGSLEHRFEVHNGVYAGVMAVSPDGVLMACGESELHLFDAETFDLLARQPLGANITALCFTAPRHIAAGLGNGQIVSVQIGW